MRFDFATRQIADYKVVTPVYEGPLDLLLHLIEQAELDITRLALAQVTDQYLEHLQTIPQRDPEEVSAFLVIAAKLVQVKSEALLPRPPVREEGEEDPGEALARQLIIYRRYKQIAEQMGERARQGLRSYLRLAPPPKLPPRPDFGTFTLDDLHALAMNLFLNMDNRPPLATVVAAPRVTIREKIRLILETLHTSTHTTFSRLLGKKRTRLDVVVTFLALLELVKRRFVRASQESLFAEIILEAESEWNEGEDFEL